MINLLNEITLLLAFSVPSIILLLIGIPRIIKAKKNNTVDTLGIVCTVAGVITFFIALMHILDDLDKMPPLLALSVPSIILLLIGVPRIIKSKTIDTLGIVCTVSGAMMLLLAWVFTSF